MCGRLLSALHWEPGHNPGMCPDWESNWRPFGVQAGAQSTKPHQPGLCFLFHVSFVPSSSPCGDVAWALRQLICHMILLRPLDLYSFIQPIYFFNISYVPGTVLDSRNMIV